MSAHEIKARFIAFEGGEGVGKSTQAKRLVEALSNHGIDALLTREPGGTAGAEMIRKLLLDPPGTGWRVQAEALLFAAARSDHVAKAIKPALLAGRWVVCDRFVLSSRAYQGQGALSDADIVALHRLGSGGFLPDRTLLLTLPDNEAALRARRRDGDQSDRIGGRDSDFHRAVASAFARFAADEPDRVRAVDASGAAEDVTDRLIAALSDLLP